MMASSPWRLALGPQRPDIYLGSATKELIPADAPVAVISAAWQEAEGDHRDIQPVMDNPLHDLELYQRADTVFSKDTALTAAYRRRQDKLKDQQRLYRLRLRQLTIAARNILKVNSDPELIADERRHAISQLRALDRHHLNQIAKIHASFNDTLGVEHNALLNDTVEDIKEQLSHCDYVLITGGNVVVLINRLKLFGLGPLLGTKHIVGLSAGAMVLTDRIVLFHDRLPQGRRDAEVMCNGLGLISDTVLLPDARQRVRKSETVRNSLFSRRFSPSTCLTLNNNSSLLFQHGKVISTERVQHISREGKFARVKAL